MSNETNEADCVSEGDVNFINTEYGKETVMCRADVIDDLVGLRRFDLEDELENDIECYESDLEEMSNQKLADWYSDYYTTGEMRLEVRKTEE